MKLWKILFVFLLVFIFFIHCSEKLLSKTIDQAVIIEKFRNNKLKKSRTATQKKKDKKLPQRCNDYFVAVPQNLKMPQKCTDPYSLARDADPKLSEQRKDSEKCKRVTSKQFCQMLKESGWDPTWTKKELVKRKDDAEIAKTRRKIQKNLGSVSEYHIKKCFPQYM
jgi:hypothetical protein